MSSPKRAERRRAERATEKLLKTEIAVDTITNPVIKIMVKNDKLLVAFDKPSIGFILDVAGLESLVNILSDKLTMLKGLSRDEQHQADH